MSWNPWDELRRLAERVDVVFAPAPIPGLYFPDEATIVIAQGQTRTMRRSVVAEELGHHVLGHRPHIDPIEVGRMELRAKRWAAERLITIEALTSAVIAASSWSEVSESLDVAPEFLLQRVADLSSEQLGALRLLVGERDFGC